LAPILTGLIIVTLYFMDNELSINFTAVLLIIVYFLFVIVLLRSIIYQNIHTKRLLQDRVKNLVLKINVNKRRL